jgi:succinate-semialdehyde dehydrogenase / glutarate-semialdehyde dehydrogenase
MKIPSINPFTEEVQEEFTLLTPDEIRAAVDQARDTQYLWKDFPIAGKTRMVQELAGVLRREQKRFARKITEEMGKPIKESLAEVEKCAWLCDYYAGTAARSLEPEAIATENLKSYVVFEPLGIVLAIMPWNFPFWQAFRFAVPAICAGNVVLLKHASNVPGTALAIEDAFRQAGFPEKVLTTLLIDASSAAGLIEQDLVDAVSLTGSNPAGEQVGATAGRRIKKLVLELGGSDPFIVLEDADVQKAGRMAARARMMNAGQSCIAAKRFLVNRNLADPFLHFFIEQLKQLKIGDPMEETTDVGPLARRDLLQELEAQLQDAREKGAQVIRWEHPFSKGFFFAPCVLLNLRADMKVLTEEVFGPIAPILLIQDDEEAIREANRTVYGLGASLWSRDLPRAERLARRIETGFVAINDMVKSDPRLPFGGIKKSGLGRELSHYGLKEFVNIKTVVVKE